MNRRAEPGDEGRASPVFFALTIGTGLAAGLIGGLLMQLLHAVQRLAWPYRAGDDFLAAASRASQSQAMLVLACAGAFAGLMRVALRDIKSAGHGSELSERIWFGAAVLAPLRTLLRAVTSVVIVGLGASLGREAAPKQMGGLAGSLLAQWAGVSASQRRLLVACGAGAGIAAVYNVPFGGATFALEALLGSMSLRLAPTALLASGLATCVSWTLTSDQSTYHVPFYPVTLDQLVFAAVASPLFGLAAVAQARLLAAADGLKPRSLLAVAAPLFVFCALAVIGFRFPQLLGNGKGATQRAFLGEFGAPTLAVLVVLKPLATAACFGAGAPGGVFTPTLTLGALLGALLGELWRLAWPGAR